MEVVIEKVVEKLIEREKPVAVPTIQEKLVKEIDYQVVTENNPVLVTKFEIMKEIHEKLVQVIQTKQEVVPVDRIIEKIVQVEKIIEQPPKFIDVKEQIMVVQKEVELVEVLKTQVAIQREEVPV